MITVNSLLKSLNEKTILAIDLETTHNETTPGKNDGLNPHRARIAVASWLSSKKAPTIDNCQYELITDNCRIIKQLALVWRNPDYVLIGANIMFDINMLYWHYPDYFSPFTRKCEVVSIDLLVRCLTGDYRDMQQDMVSYAVKEDKPDEDTENIDDDMDKESRTALMNLTDAVRQPYVCASYSLASLSRDLLNIELDKSHQKDDWSQQLSEEQVKYIKLDVLTPMLIWKRLIALFGADKPQVDYIESPLAFYLSVLAATLKKEQSEVIANNIITELKAWYTTQLLNATLFNVDLTYYKELVPQIDSAYTYWRDQFDALEDLNPTQVKRLSAKYNVKHLNRGTYMLLLNGLTPARLYKDSPSGDLAHLKHVLHKRIAIEAINKARQNADSIKGLFESTGTVGINWSNWNSCSGTGRTVSSNKGLPYPNLQAIKSRMTPLSKQPDEPDVNFNLRKLIIPKPGYTFLNVDAPTAHLRIALGLCNCENGLTMLRDGTDIHSYIGYQVYNQQEGKSVTYDEFIELIDKDKLAKNYRGWAKNTVFAWLNQAGAKRIRQQIETNSMLPISLEVVTQLRELIDSTFPELSVWCKAVYRWLLSNRQIAVGKHYFSLLECPMLDVLKPQYRPHLVFPGRFFNKYADGYSALMPSYTAIPAAIWARIEVLIMKQFNYDVMMRYPYEQCHLIINHYDGVVFEIKDELFDTIAHEIVDMFEHKLQDALVNNCPTGINLTYRKETIDKKHHWM